jgi:hypothetical protein
MGVVKLCRILEIHFQNKSKVFIADKIKLIGSTNSNPPVGSGCDMALPYRLFASKKMMYFDRSFELKIAV